jgi:hypothetical protein
MFELYVHMYFLANRILTTRHRGFVILALYENLEIKVQNMQILAKVDRTTRESNLL